MPLPAKYCFPHNGYEVSTRLLYLYLYDIYYPDKTPRKMPKSITSRIRNHCIGKNGTMSAFTRLKVYRFLRATELLPLIPSVFRNHF